MAQHSSCYITSAAEQDTDWKRGTHLGEGAGAQLLHECAGHDAQVIDGAGLQGLKIGPLQVGGTIVLGKAARQAGVVEVVVRPQVRVAGDAVECAGDVLRDAEAVLVDEAVLLAGHSTPEPAEADKRCEPWLLTGVFGKRALISKRFEANRMKLLELVILKSRAMD